MKYFKAHGVEDGEWYYFEIDDDNVAYRQVTIIDDHCSVSIAPDFQLSETEVEIFEGDEEISAEAFGEVWTRAIEPYKPAWERAKQCYSLHHSVAGAIAMFYPQGVIVKIEEDVYAIADFNEVRKSAKLEHLYPGYRITGTVKGYDENNFWLVLEQ
ncbi:hypothetical protein [Paenibacillus sp. GCM10027626]|uniref:hypothetical protein n=1 Tax=Paenibacillus sp. GCM10027626 TaxID=3273411 RepID=UPI0036277517